jgi:hypothetical protein
MWESAEMTRIGVDAMALASSSMSIGRNIDRIGRIY